VFQHSDKNPLFDFVCELDRVNEDKIVIEIWNEAAKDKERLIGEVFIPITQVISKGNKMTDWFPVLIKTKECGQLFVDVEFMPELSGKAGFQPGGFTNVESTNV
jgi:Ca2+-dependent lipid-binding protein